jgi:hypothetical protein
MKKRFMKIDQICFPVYKNMLYFALMNTFLRYSGIFVQLTGVLFLVVPYFSNFQNNTTLVVGLTLIVLGFLLYIWTNKRIY